MNQEAAIFILGIVLVIYLPPTVIFWRNVKLSQPWKAIFSLSIGPLFIVAMGFNIVFASKYAGWLLDYTSANAKVSGIIASCPIALLICFAWYRLVRTLDALTHKGSNSRVGVRSQ